MHTTPCKLIASLLQIREHINYWPNSVEVEFFGHFFSVSKLGLSEILFYYAEKSDYLCLS